MLSRATRRLTTTALVVLSLLFSQLALAAYTCPMGMTQPQAAMEMEPGQPCEGMGTDSSQPVLCHQHCVNAPQSPDTIKVPTVGLPAVVQILVVPLATDAAALDARVHAVRVEGQPPPEPIFLSTLRLRV